MSAPSKNPSPAEAGTSPDFHYCFDGCVSDSARVKTDAVYRAAYGTNASHYDCTPQAVIEAASAEEVAAIFAQASRHRIPVTLRAGGTSLSGQSVSESVCIDIARRFRGMEILDGGKRVRVQPGLTIDEVNARLKPYGRKLGPDPASTSVAMIGGVIANNSSGMACGTEFNSYNTIESLKFVLPSGTIIDSADPHAHQLFAEREPELVSTLERLSRRVRGNGESVRSIEKHFAIKNSMGYSLNAFLDFDRPLDQFVHLLVGSEGTLAFIAEAVFRTLPLHPFAATSLAVFNTLTSATDTLPALVDSGAAALELLDDISIRIGQNIAGTPDDIRGFEPDGHTALLLEYQGDTQEEVDALALRGEEILTAANLYAPARFTADATERATAWKFRKSMYPVLAQARPTGTMALIEDISVPVDSLTDTVVAMQELLARHNYKDAPVLGHAKDGNLHFLMLDEFGTDADLARYSAFTDELVDTVLRFEGNLKAEHGTGRVMAPYVRRQYGDELYDVARELKFAVDPGNWMNPNVIITDDEKLHVKNLKKPPAVDKKINSCVECGFCEPVCPSRHLTLTPRQRIAVQRARAKADRAGDTELVAQLDSGFDYPGVDTCAADSMCATACPVGIDTGKFIKSVRATKVGAAKQSAWTVAAKRWDIATTAASTALTVAKAAPAPVVTAATGIGRVVIDPESIPLYTKDLPRGGASRARLGTFVGHADGKLAGIYLPACVNTMFGPARGGTGVTEAFVSLLDAARLRLFVPSGISGLCCATPWSSKGLTSGASIMSAKVADAITESLEAHPELAGLPIVSDASSCTEGFAEILSAQSRSAGSLSAGRRDVRVIDAVEFAANEIIDRVEFDHPVDSLTLHPTCSSLQLGLNPALEKLANAAAKEVHIPTGWHCCGFAGDRGMLHPELTGTSAREEAEDVAAIDASAHASCNRTCEIGMTRATGKPYRHILELLAAACAKTVR